MKKTVMIVLAMALLLAAGCNQFPTSYDRIEPDKARLLDFIYEPADAAPGDTVLLKAVFAGRPVNADELTWKISQKILVNEYGTTVALDTIPLAIIPEASTFSDRTSCIAFKFVIPQDIIVNSPMVPEKLTDLLPDYYGEALPPELSSLTKSDLLDMIEMIGMLSSSPDAASQFTNDTNMAFLPMLVQSYSVPVRLYCTIKDDHTIISDYQVRYNSRFANVPEFGIPVNRNPKVDSIGIYRVKADDLTTFDPSTSKHSFEYSPLNDTGVTTVTIDKGYTYFVGVVTGNVDSTKSIDAAMENGDWLPEQHEMLWYVEFDKTEIEEVSPYDLATIDGDDFSSGRHFSQLYPSIDTKITECTAWLEVDDQFLNEYFRPQGSTLKEIRLRFEYTDAYKKSVKK